MEELARERGSNTSIIVDISGCREYCKIGGRTDFALPLSSL